MCDKTAGRRGLRWGGMEEKLHYILMGGAMTSSTTLWQVLRRVNPPGAEESWEIRFLEVTG